MQYRHIYHAGNFADVFKHCILISLLQSLLQKEKPIFYLDTHAGIGRYDLTSPKAQKTKEYLNGIGRLYNLRDLSACPHAVKTYLEIVNAIKGSGEKNGIGGSINLPIFYPGSPYIVHSLLRPQDRMVFVELYPEDVVQLKKEFYGDKRVGVHYLNGFQSLKAFLPPKQGRGLILIDPAFEDKNELQNIIDALQIALNRFPIGIYAIWYPIKDHAAIRNFYNALKQLNAKNILFSELAMSKNPGKLASESTSRLNACGMAIINAPWQFEEKLKPLLIWLNKQLGSNMLPGNCS